MKRKLLSILLCLAMALSLLPTAALAEGETTGAGTIKVGGETYSSFSDAVNEAEPDGGVITYEISGKVDVTATDWVQVAKAGLTDLSKVEFIGITDDAEICITQGKAILADQSYDIDVSFEALKLTKLDPQWASDFGHSTNYFTCWLRNKNAEENTVTYTKCTFPNGVCNNQYGKTVFNNCQFTNSANYNLWNYGGNTEVKDSAFSGVRGIKTYNEGTLTVAPTVKIEQTTFSGLTEKAAIVVSKATNITLTNVTATGCTMGLLQKDIEGSTDEQKVTIEANGTGISGDFNITAEMGAEAAKNEFNISGGTFTSEVEQDYCKDGFEVKAGTDGNYTVEPSEYVAKVGGTGYPTLDAALAALNGTNHTLTLIDGSKWTYDNVYWKAGTESGSAATLKAAMEAAYAKNAESITIICKPNATITTSPAHIDVTGDITVYANGADFGGNDLSIGTYKAPKNNTATINIYDARNLVVWGQPVGDRADVWNVNFTDCVNDGWNFLMYRGDETGIAKINATLTSCKATGFVDSIIHTTADGRITIKNCEFADNCAPVNIAHKQAGAMTVTVENSTFTKCGSTSTENKLNQYAAPVRIVNNNETGTVTTEVTNCTFTDTVGNNGDILIGDGRDGKDSNDVTLTVSGTAANVQAQKPGYYGADGAVSNTSLVRKTSVVKSTTPVTITLDNDAFDLAQVGDTGYSNLTDAISAAQSGGKTVTLLTADDVLLQAILDGQYGSIDGLTIELPTGSYGQLELGRATKYAGSNTEYYVGGFDESAANYQKFDSAEELKTYKDGEGWTPNCYYVRNMNDVTLKAAAGADVEIAGMTATAGHIYGTSGAPVTDYVLDTTTESTGDSYYLAQNWGNITFEGLTFTAKVDIASSLEKTAIDGVSFENCNFDINNTASGNQALRYYNELDNEKVSGLTVDNCTFTNCFQGVYTQKIKNITVTNSTFDTTAHNAIAIQSGDNAANHGDVVITNNTFTNIGDRIIRFNNVAEGTNITITDNTATNSGDDTGEVIKATSIAEGVPTTIYSNNWGPGTTVGNDEFQDTAAPSSGGSSSSSGDYSISVDADKHGTVTVSPKRADKGDTVTITVKPNKGYELDELTVTDANGNEISVRSRGNNQYTFTMPRSRVTIEATFAEIEEEPDLFFVDVPTSAYYYDAVYWAAENGVTYGTSATTFSPDVIVSRAQMVTFLWRAHGSPEPRSSVTPFTDVSSSAYYYDAVLWAVENGVTNGTSATTFSPDATVTRAQAVTFQWRAAGSPAVSGGSFADVADSAYYAGAVSWAVANGVTNGTGGSNFSPDVGVSRAQAVTFLWRQLA